MSLNALLLLLEEEEDDDMVVEVEVKERGKHHEIYKNRRSEGCYELLVKKHLKCDDIKFCEYFRLSRAQFDKVLYLIKNDVKRQSSNLHVSPISATEKLAVTIRFLATGESLRSLAFQFRISHSYISRILKETLASICKRLMCIFIPTVTKDMLKTIADNFLKRWNFPNCCGAIDGKHVRIKCPKNSGSLYHNYKHFFSIVMLAIVDADCKFIYLDIGSYGKESDSAIFSKSIIGKKIESGRLDFPDDAALPGSDIFFPHFMIGDGGFKLLPRLMKPYPNAQSEVDVRKRQYNYRLSRARRTVESAFGMLSNVFRVFYTPIDLAPETMDQVILASCCLHNLLIEDKGGPYIREENIIQPTENLLPLRRAGSAEVVAAINLRNELKEYICSIQGRVTWQSEMA